MAKRLKRPRDPIALALLFSVATLEPAFADQAATITDTDAAAHVGQTVTVEGCKARSMPQPLPGQRPMSAEARIAIMSFILP